KPRYPSQITEVQERKKKCKEIWLNWLKVKQSLINDTGNNKKAKNLEKLQNTWITFDCGRVINKPIGLANDEDFNEYFVQ
ncbi:MAG: hypothetical protein QXR96_02665, partial [Candidatus Woesearchaeota archaeon]